MEKVLEWWRRSLLLALGLSIALIGVGRIELLSDGGSFSAWSVSRTTLIFWLIHKLLLWVRAGRLGDLRRFRGLTPLFVFFAMVTFSLLPDFRDAGDYRYFLFGCAHSIMIVDLFSGLPQKRWLPFLCGVLPVISVFRGLLHDPSIFNLALAHRFGFPFDHANTAGYVLAMSIPLALGVTLSRSSYWSGVGAASFISQASALLLTYSRGAWLGCAAALFFLLSAAAKWKLLVGLGLLAVGCLLALPSIRDRLDSIGRLQDDESASERAHLFVGAFRLGVDHPVLGVGYGRGRLKAGLRPHVQGTPLEKKAILHSHNVYVELFAGTGLAGLLAFVWLLAAVFLRLWQSARKQAGPARILGFAFAASWLAAMVAGLGDIPFYHHETRIFFFTLIGIACLDCASGADDTEPSRAPSSFPGPR